MTRSAFTLPPPERVAISASPGELRVATLRGGRPWELLVARDSRPSLVGNIYLGRVRHLERGLDAAFVDLGESEPGFLPLPGSGGIGEGDALLVQVTRDAVDGKGPTVTTRIALPGRYLVYTPGRPGLAAARRAGDADRRRRLQGALLPQLEPDEGVILRSAAAIATEPWLTAELGVLRRQWRALRETATGAGTPALLHRDLPALPRFLRDRAMAPEILFDDGRALAEARAYVLAHAPDLAAALGSWSGTDPLFEALGVEDEIERAVGGAAPLPSGGTLHVAVTRALTAIDVDSSGHTGRAPRRRGAETWLAVNLEAAIEAARVIRFRNLAGPIVIDFASLRDRAARKAVDDRLRAAFAEDIAESRILPMSELGLVEIGRQRLGPSLPELLGALCPTCGGRGRVVDPETVALAGLRAALRAAAAEPGGRPCLSAVPAVVGALRGPLAAALRETEARLGQCLDLRADPVAPSDRATVEMMR